MEMTSLAENSGVNRENPDRENDSRVLSVPYTDFFLLYRQEIHLWCVLSIPEDRKLNPFDTIIFTVL